MAVAVAVAVVDMGDVDKVVVMVGVMREEVELSWASTLAVPQQSSKVIANAQNDIR